MSSSMSLHDVKMLNIARDVENRWTTLTIKHETWGYDAQGLYSKVEGTFEITLHHTASERLKVRTRKRS